MKLRAWKPALFVAAMVLAVSPGAGHARPGDLDPAFSDDGLGQYTIARQAGTGGIPAEAIPSVSMTPAGLAPDGDLVLGGATGYSWDCTRLGCFRSRSLLALARVEPSGELDADFGNGGVIETGLGFSTDTGFGPIWGPVPFAVQDDGRMVAAFGVASGGQPPGPRVARFLSDGSLDPSFSGDGIAAVADNENSPQITAVAVQDDGRIVVVGDVDAHNYSPFTIDADLMIARLLANGEPDPAFGGDGVRTYDFGLDDRFADVALDEAGRIVAAGTGSHASSFDQIAFSHDVAVARFLDDGSPDPGFSDDGHTLVDLIPDRGSNAVFGDLTLAGDRPVVIAAAHPDAVGFEGIFAALVGLDASGQADPGFGSGGIARLERIADLQGPGSFAIEAQDDGSLLIGGGGYRSLLLGRHLANGAPDPGFGDSGWLEVYPPAGFSTAPTAGSAGLIVAGNRGIIGGTTAAGPRRAQVARFRLDPAPPDDRDADGVLDPGDRCPGVYVPGAGCPPPFSLRVTLDRWPGHRSPGNSIGGAISGGTSNCVPPEIVIYRARDGRDKRLRKVDHLHFGSVDAFSSPFETGWSIAFKGAVRRGGPLYVRAAPRFDPSVGKCKGDRSKVVEVPRGGQQRD